MTTARQIKKLVAPLLARNADLALARKQFVTVCPVRHLLRAVVIDRTSERKQFRPRWTVFHLFALRTGYSVYCGADLYRKGRWYIDVPGIEDELCSQIEADALPRLRAVATIADYIALATGPGIFMPPLASSDQRMLAHIAMGECEAARAICVRRSPFWDTDRDPYLQTEMECWKTLRPLLMDDDRVGLAALLHVWEAQTVANLELTHLWERTPFPLEEGGSESKGGMPSSAAHPSE